MASRRPTGRALPSQDALSSPPVSAPMALFPACPLPACLNLTSDPRQPCEACLAAFGPRLRPAGEPVTAAEFTALIKLRDEEVQAVLAERRQMTPLPEPDVEWKQGQRCWVCEQRRKCRRDPGCPDRWICGGCLEMP